MATMTVADLSTELGTDPRTARKFLRTVTPRDEQPGKGGRWSIERKSLRSLKKQFAEYEERIAARAASRDADDDAPEGDDTPDAE